MPDGLEIEVVDRSSLDATDRRAIVALCSDAPGVDCEGLFGFFPPDAMHVRPFVDERLVGHACWATRVLRVGRHQSLRTAFVDTVVVAPEHQRHGIGSAVMRHVAELTDGFDLRALGTERIAFFGGLGWEAWEGPDAGILHDPADTLMVLWTATTPPLDLRASIIGA
jgi:GNAT superfamily N-acetyltransferase